MTEYLISLTSLIAGGLLILLPAGLLLAYRYRGLWDEYCATRFKAAVVLAVLATLGSLYYSEIANYIPCRLCWFQRIGMYPLAILGALAWFRGELALLRPYLRFGATLGFCVSAYHILIELNPSWEGDACSAVIPCATPYFLSYGFLTLAWMAAIVFAWVIVLLRPPREG
jgi:disulfide bond formation protein DsbB